MSSEYHIPVMLAECLEGLQIDPTGVYVDLTFGAGGHSRAIVERLTTGKLYGFDQDHDALANVISDDRFEFIQSNFMYLYKMMRLEGVNHVDGILADLGVSSHQLDYPERGFSFRFDARLDMRMSERSDVTAADVIATYSAEGLQGVFSKYGEVRNAKTLAEAIVAAREVDAVKTTFDLNKILENTWVKNYNRYFAQVYQALRIEVNREMEVLESMLTDCMRVLRPKGRLVVMSYHSLEDRLVKNLMKTGNVKGEMQQDEYGKIDRPFKLITKKPVMASDAEVQRNPRARSAKLRIAQRK